MFNAKNWNLQIYMHNTNANIKSHSFRKSDKPCIIAVRTVLVTRYVYFCNILTFVLTQEIFLA